MWLSERPLLRTAENIWDCSAARCPTMAERVRVICDADHSRDPLWVIPSSTVLAASSIRHDKFGWGTFLRPRTLRIGAKWGLPREKS